MLPCRALSRRAFCGTILTIGLTSCVPFAEKTGGYAPTLCGAPRTYGGKPKLAARIELPLKRHPLSSPPLPAPAAKRLDSVLDEAMQRSGASAINAAVRVPDKGVWESTRPRSAPAIAQWASAGKTFTATAILMLVDRGTISLDDPVSKWIEDVPNGNAITVRHLLSHTSGLFSANEDRTYRRAPRILSLAEEISILKRHGAMFCPGENWRYSNSNYSLLGAVLSRVEGRPYNQVISDLILKPLHLTRTRVASESDTLDDVVPPQAPGPGEIAADPRKAGPAGGIVGPASEMLVFWQALLEARLISPAALRMAFQDLYPMFDQPMYYGLGVMAYPLQDGPLLIGHSGGGAGLKTVIVYDTTRQAFAAVSVSGQKGAEATALALLEIL